MVIRQNHNEYAFLTHKVLRFTFLMFVEQLNQNHKIHIKIQTKGIRHQHNDRYNLKIKTYFL